MALERHCTLLLNMNETKDRAQQIETIMEHLESGSDEEKRNALKLAILFLLNGEDLSKALMIVIRFCVTTKDHQLKKLLELYWESVNKYDAAGKLLPEMILVCNALLNDLNHPNEFICGCTLRFLCKIHEAELLDPLIPAIKKNLEHRHYYVRANAVLSLHSVYKNFPDMVSDAPELLESFLDGETDRTARRNAFLCLFHMDHRRATSFLVDNWDQIDKFGDGFQLVVLELARKVCKANPNEKSRFVRIIYQLLQSEDPAVSFEAASTLCSLSSAPTAIRAAASCFCQLVVSHSDNNVKLIMLERIASLKKHHLKVLQELIMDVLRALASPNLDIRRKTLDIATELISPSNIAEVMLVLKKELSGVQSSSSSTESSDAEYRIMLIQSIHKCAVKFPEVAGSVVPLLMEFLGASEGDSAVSVVQFLREIVDKFADLRPSILQQLMALLPNLRSGRVTAVACWILGEYSDSGELIKTSFLALKQAVGPLPITAIAPASPGAEEDATPATAATSAGGPKVLADGSYASQVGTDTAAAASTAVAAALTNRLRKQLLGNDLCLSAAVAVALTKLSLRATQAVGDKAELAKKMAVDVLIIICALLDLARKNSPDNRVPIDHLERLRMCIHVLTDPEADQIRELWLHSCRAAFGMFLKDKEAEEERKKSEKTVVQVVEPDHVINFRQLRKQISLGASQIDLDDDADISKATSSVATRDSASSSFRRVHQLTGSDALYAEAVVTVHDYDIVLSITVFNRSKFSMNNLSVELATIGDLKLVDRPQSYTLEAGGMLSIKTSIKVRSTETGHVFGNIVYNSGDPSLTKAQIININDIHIDIMDYINPATCSTAEFRRMWAEFEWENKVAVNTNITDLQDYLRHILSIANMKCLTPMESLSDECQFLAANLYARSVFGEDALVNLSVERRGETHEEYKIFGYIRIRSKTQGIALSLGDRINNKQRDEETKTNGKS